MHSCHTHAAGNNRGTGRCTKRLIALRGCWNWNRLVVGHCCAWGRARPAMGKGCEVALAVWRRVGRRLESRGTAPLVRRDSPYRRFSNRRLTHRHRRPPSVLPPLLCELRRAGRPPVRHAPPCRPPTRRRSDLGRSTPSQIFDQEGGGLCSLPHLHSLLLRKKIFDGGGGELK
jgi:hypothetical protein